MTTQKFTDLIPTESTPIPATPVVRSINRATVAIESTQEFLSLWYASTRSATLFAIGGGLLGAWLSIEFLLPILHLILASGLGVGSAGAIGLGAVRVLQSKPEAE